MELTRLSIALALVFALNHSLKAQSKEPSKPPSQTASTVRAPEVVRKFVQSAGDVSDGEAFHRKAQDALWEVYPGDDSLKTELVAFVVSGPDGPEMGFAGLALIPFHDPATVKPMMDRVLNPKTSPATRWAFLNAAPCILAIGDVWYDGEGRWDKDVRDMAKEFTQFAEEAKVKGLGRVHDAQLRQIYDLPKKEKEANPDYGLVIWHSSAYLLGTLDLRDEEVLRVFFSPEDRNVFANVMSALSYATNHNFLAPLQSKENVTHEEELAAAQQARTWWQEYLRAHPDGDWLPAVLSGFREAGYKLEDDLRSPQTTRELLRALAADSQITRYNAARLLNHIYGTHFDLERIFLAGKYALGPFDPSGQEEQNEGKLRNYWRSRFKDIAQE